MLLRCLCCECLAVSDNFNRADEAITTANPIPGTDWFWETGGSPNSITSNELVVDDGSFIKLRPDTGIEGVPRQFQFEIDVKIPQDSKTVRIEYHCILDGTPEAELHLELLSSDGTTGACGRMRLTNGTTALTDWIQVNGLDAGSFVTIELCYSAEQQILTATVAGVSVKVTGAAAATPVNGTTNESEIWLVPDDPTLPTFFDNMRLRRIRTIRDGDYGDADNCPLCDCARNDGCSTESDDFEDAAIDCRWVEEDGSWTEGDVDGEGCLYTGSDDALIVRKTHGCGFDGDGGIDNTVKVAVSLHTLETGLENEAKIFFDFIDIDNCHWVLIRFADNADSNEVTVNGRMEVWSSTDGLLETKDWGPINLLPGLPYSVTVCFDGETVIADIGTGDPLEVDVEAFGGPFTGLGTGTINAGTVFFHSWELNRDIYNSECGDCFSEEASSCDDCCDEPLPLKHYKIRVEGNATSAHCSGNNAVPKCNSLAGSYIVKEIAFPECTWRYSKNAYSGVALDLSCCFDPDHEIILTIQLTLMTDGDECYWVAQMGSLSTVTAPEDTGCTFDEGDDLVNKYVAYGTYESERFAAGLCREPITLTKQSEVGIMCTEWPDEIELEIP